MTDTSLFYEPAGLDLMPTADGRDKSISASRARLARILGSDAADEDNKSWDLLARWFAEAQIRAITNAAMLVMSRCVTTSAIPVIAAGMGTGVVAGRAGWDFPGRDSTNSCMSFRKRAMLCVIAHRQGQLPLLLQKLADAVRRACA
jgi:hypothetical protein